MKYFNWNDEKRDWIEKTQNIKFMDIVHCIQKNNLLKIVEHPDKLKYPYEEIYVLKYNNYIYLVPYIEAQQEVILKSAIPSSEATKEFLGEKKDKNVHLTTFESEILVSYEDGKWQDVKDMDKAIKRHTEYAIDLFEINKPVDIKLSKRDIILLKKRALAEGMPFHKLLYEILHKYAIREL